MASLKDKFLYGASGTKQPGDAPAGEKRRRNDLIRPFLRNFGTMVQYNLVALLFMVPAVLWTGVCLILLNDQAAAAADMTALWNAAYPVLSTWLLWMIPLWVVADIGACGVAAMFRRVIEGKKLAHWQVFSQAVKHHALPVALLGAALGILLWLLLSAMNFYTVMAQTMPAMHVMQALGVVVLLVILAAEAMMIPTLLGASGEKKWRRAIGEALTAAIWHMPACLSAIALTVLLPLALLLIPAAGVFIWGVYEMVIGLSVRQYAFTAIAEMLGLGATEPVDDDDY